MTAREMIRQSAMSGEIYNHAFDGGWDSDYAKDLIEGLESDCDDSVKNGDVYEFWGDSEHGEWRVHLETE